MFKLRNFKLLSTKWAHLNLMPATGLKKAGTGQQRAEKARYLENIQLGEHLATY